MKNRLHRQFPPDLRRVLASTAVSDDRRAGDHTQPPDSRELRDQFLGDSVRQIAFVGIRINEAHRQHRQTVPASLHADRLMQQRAPVVYNIEGPGSDHAENGGGAVLVATGCTPLDQETTYTFTVQARDVDGNLSPFSDPVFVTTDPADPNDHMPPTQPVNVTAEADGGHIMVRWDPSTDDLAPQTFIRYDVYVNGELRAVVVGQASAVVEVDLGVNNISVIAVDTADNESAPGTTTLIL
jgi:hypothetical protein